MRARIHDPVGPRRARYLVPSLGGLAGALAFTLPLSGPGRGALFFAGMILLLAAPLVIGRRRPQVARLELGAGVVRVRDAGLLDQSIHARAITGMTTASDARGVLVHLQLRGRRDHAILLQLASVADANRLRDALGVGHHGFGMVSVPTALRAIDWADTVVRVIAVVMWTYVLIIAAASFASADPSTLWLQYGAFMTFAAMPLTLLTGLLMLVRQGPAPGLVLHTYGVTIRDAKCTRCIPYQTIASAGTDDESIVLAMRGADPIHLRAPVARWSRDALSHDERTAIAAQIRAAALRAQGATPKEDPSARLDLLRRGSDSPRAWLARLDAMAHALATHAGYRDVSIDQADLWAALEDPEQDGELRAAAARVLVAGDATRVRSRVEALAAATRDELTAQRLRVAVEADADAVTDALEHIDTLAERAAAR